MAALATLTGRVINKDRESECESLYAIETNLCLVLPSTTSRKHTYSPGSFEALVPVPEPGLTIRD